MAGHTAGVVKIMRSSRLMPKSCQVPHVKTNRHMINICSVCSGMRIRSSDAASPSHPLRMGISTVERAPSS